MYSGVGECLCVNISLHSIFHYAHLHELNDAYIIISSIDTLLQGMSFSVTCQTEGHALSVFCLIAANNCSDPGAPTNGKHSLFNTTNNSVVTYTCDVGYTLQGSNSRTCQSNGQWNGSVPQCNGTSYKELAVIVAECFAHRLADWTCFTLRCMKSL